MKKPIKNNNQLQLPFDGKKEVESQVTTIFRSHRSRLRAMELISREFVCIPSHTYEDGKDGKAIKWNFSIEVKQVEQLLTQHCFKWSRKISIKDVN